MVPPSNRLPDEFKSVQAGFVILEEDMVLARTLQDRGYNVVFGKLAKDPSIIAPVKDAKAVVVDAGDHANASCTLTAREFGFTGPLYALAEIR